MLMLHCGAKPVTVEEVNKAPCPEGTKKWTPIPHGVFLDLVKASVKKAGFAIGQEQYGLYDDGSRLFGVVEITGQDYLDGQVQLIMGIRNGNDRKMSAGICAGSKVFVCDNLSFMAYTDKQLGTEPVAMRRYHSGRVMDDIEDSLDEAMSRMLVLKDYQEQFFQTLRTRKLETRGVNDIIIRAAEAENPAIPWGHIQHVKKQWDLQHRKPENEEEAKKWHEEFTEENAWSLYNCFTEVAKGYLGQNTLAASNRSIAMNNFFRSRFGKN